MILVAIFWILIFIIFIILFVISLSYNYNLIIDYNDSFSTEFYFGNKLINFRYLKNKNIQKSFIKFLSFEKEITKDDTVQEDIDEIIDEKVDKTKKEKKKTKSSFPIKLINIENLKHVFNFLYKLYKELKPDSININLFIAFSDPYYNALMLANYYSLKAVYPNFPIKITTYWDREVIEGQGKVKGKIKPIFLLFFVFKFVLSLKTLKFFWQYRKR